MTNGVDDNDEGSISPLQIEEQSLLERWQHLADLADFALAMKVTLTKLNDQSFNNFMLRIGKCVRVPASVRVCVCLSDMSLPLRSE